MRRTKFTPILIAYGLSDTNRKSLTSKVLTSWILRRSGHLFCSKQELPRRKTQNTAYAQRMTNNDCSAGMTFAATHAEGVFVSAPSPHILAPRVANIRATAAALGRDPQSIKIFAVITPIIGRTEEEAQAKYQEALKYTSTEGGLTFYSGNAGIDLSQYDLDKIITPEDVTVDGRIHSLVNSLKYHGNDLPAWTPRNIGKLISIGGNGPVPVGSVERVADIFEEWMDVADLDGFNVGYVTTPGSFEDLVDLLIPELRRRGRYVPKGEPVTLREKVFGKGQSRLRDDHVGSKYKYENYVEEDA
jgi:hypothetical protein